ncbi:hypothetical protein PROFUN_03417 [Planoprotostelium fungivorum]|uniref:Cation-transporting P-type ATPase C-terminal domain-containing protein n=1 Tax=Planoprotostelium fungivorum TaxID=1890364 RepID=A0A2P6NWP8_9EUKA|nr:hypothetical protein PROFUN_03417 [Planoprotostelium fungivorum]
MEGKRSNRQLHQTSLSGRQLTSTQGNPIPSSEEDEEFPHEDIVIIAPDQRQRTLSESKSSTSSSDEESQGFYEDDEDFQEAPNQNKDNSDSDSDSKSHKSSIHNEIEHAEDDEDDEDYLEESEDDIRALSNSKNVFTPPQSPGKIASRPTTPLIVEPTISIPMIRLSFEREKSMSNEGEKSETVERIIVPTLIVSEASPPETHVTSECPDCSHESHIPTRKVCFDSNCTNYRTNASVQNSHSGSEDEEEEDNGKYDTILSDSSETELPGANGFSTTEAKRLLVRAIEEKIEEEKREGAVDFAADWLRYLYCAMAFVAGCLLLAAYIISVTHGLVYAKRNYVHLLVEAILLLLVSFSNVIFHYWQAKNRMLHTFNKLKAHLQYYQTKGDPFEDLHLDHTTLNKSVRMVSVLRDGQWRKNPMNLIVEGDVIGLLKSEPAWAHMTCLENEYHDLELFEGQTVADKLPDVRSSRRRSTELVSMTKRMRYKILETPALSQLGTLFGQKRHNLSPFQNSLKYSLHWTLIAMVMSLVLATVVGFIRYFSSEFRNDGGTYYSWTIMFLVRTAYVCIPLCHLALPHLYLVASCYEAAKIMSFFHVQQTVPREEETPSESSEEEGENSTKSSSRRNSEVSYDNVKIPIVIDSERHNKLEAEPFVPHRLTLQYFMALLRDPLITNQRRMVEVLGAVTLVCNIDREGIIAESMLQPEHVYIYRHNEEPSSGGVILDLSRIPNHRGGSVVKFDDMDWKRHIMSLKPLGLNCLLNRGCKTTQELKTPQNSAASVNLQCIIEREDPGGVYNQCLCTLGHEIGFTQDALSTFSKLKEIDTFLPHISRHNQLGRVNHCMRSLVVEERNSGSLQLLSKGSPQFLINHCTAYWDGETVRNMTPAERHVISSSFKKWAGADTIAFAYRPIDAQYAALFADIQSQARDSPHNTSNHSQARDHVDSPVTIHLHKNHSMNDLITIEDQAINSSGHHVMGSPAGSIRMRKQIHSTRKKRLDISNVSNGATPRDNLSVVTGVTTPRDNMSTLSVDDENHDDEMLKQLQQNQIFIGMVSARQYPKIYMHKNVEYLREAGIRFVLFVPEDEEATSFFADKLGLETDWNCNIRLKELAEGEVEDPADNPAHLPRGIPAIRQHLEDDIDNVPLLVPMFSQANTTTTRDMIEIFQENGDVVCCFGSALDQQNSQIFIQADVSISMEPDLRICNDESPFYQDEEHPLITSINFGQYKSTRSLSCDITSLPSTFVMHRKCGLFDIIKLIQHSRHALINLKSCMVLYQYSCWLIHLLLLISFVLFPSTVVLINGYQLLWLVVVIVPILSVSLLFTKRDPDVMAIIPAKNRLEFKHLWRLAFILGIRTMFNILACSIVFIWSLFEIWPDCSWRKVFGRDFAKENYESDEFTDSLLYSQNIFMLGVVFYLSVGSVSLLYRHKSVMTKDVLINRRYLICVITSLLVQIVFFIVSVSSTRFLLDRLRWYFYVFFFIWPIIMVSIDELLKVREREWFARQQKGLQLDFDTHAGSEEKQRLLEEQNAETRRHIEAMEKSMSQLAQLLLSAGRIEHLM